MTTRPLPRDVVNTLAARMTIPAPTGDPAPFVRACSCEIRPHPSAGLVWVAMTVDRSCGQGHKHGQAFETTRPEEI